MKHISLLFSALLFTSTYALGATKKTQTNKKNTKQSSEEKKSSQKSKTDQSKTKPTTTNKPQPQQASKKIAEPKKSPQPTKQKSIAAQPAVAKQVAPSSSLLAKPIPFVKKSAPMSLTPGAEGAQEFVNIMVSHTKKSDLEKDLLSNNPSSKTIDFLGLELRKAYPSINLDDATNMIHDAIAEQIFNKRTSAEFMNFVRNTIKGYWNMPNKSPMLEFFSESNLTPEEQENLSTPLSNKSPMMNLYQGTNPTQKKQENISRKPSNQAPMLELYQGTLTPEEQENLSGAL